MKRKWTALLAAASMVFVTASSRSVIAAVDGYDTDITLGESSVPLETERDVEFPPSLSFTIDPFEKAGRGQVYSEPLCIINHSAEDMEIRMEDLVCAFSDPDIEWVEPIDLFDTTGRKELALHLIRTDLEDCPEVDIKPDSGEPIDFVLESGEEAVFEIRGEASPNPSNPWQEGDVSIHVTFLYRPIAEPVQEPVQEKIDLSEFIDTPTLGDSEAL